MLAPPPTPTLPQSTMATFTIKNAITPSSVAESDKVFSFKKADVKKSGKKLAFSELRNGNFPACLRISGALTTNGINSTEHETYGPKWSFGIQIYEESDIATLLQWSGAENLSTAFVLPDNLDPANVTAVPMFKDGVLYIKCPISKDGKTFAFTSNMKMTPKKPSQELFREMPVDVYVNAMAYLSQRLDEESEGAEQGAAQWGLSLKIKHVDFWTDPAMMNPTANTDLPTPTATPPTPMTTTSTATQTTPVKA